jgi:hypothetical protein
MQLTGNRPVGFFLKSWISHGRFPAIDPLRYAAKALTNCRWTI